MYLKLFVKKASAEISFNRLLLDSDFTVKVREKREKGLKLNPPETVFYKILNYYFELKILRLLIHLGFRHLLK